MKTKGEGVVLVHSKKTKGIIITYILVAQLGSVPIMALLYWLTPNLSETSKLSISMIVSFIVALGLILFKIRKEIGEMKEVKTSVRTAIIYGISGFCAALLIQNITIPIITYLTGGLTSTENEQLLTEMTRIHWVFIVVPSLIGPILEEIVFRYAILGSLVKKIKPIYAMMISSLIFAIAHFNLINLTVHFLVGMVFAYIYLRSKNILAPIIAHLIMNSFVMVLYLSGIN